ncbi:MAG TPA: APC family permease [Jatrophihabitans sp.]|nr:APC family permease [Jatrophihabitans sp.]
MDELQAAPPETEATALHKGRLGVIGIVFFVVAAAGPLVGMTGALPPAMVLGSGTGVPGAYVLIGIVLVIFSIGYSAMSHHITNTGAFFAYVGRGLGIGPGVGSAYTSLVAYLAIQLAVYGFFGATMKSQAIEHFDLDWAWWVWAFIAWALVLLLSLFSVDVGAKVLGGLMLLELGSLLLMSLAVFFQGGGDEGLVLSASFAPDKVLVGGLTGPAGISLSFAFASYIGFEATAIYGEEAKNPKRTVPRATYAAVGTITVLFGMTTFAVVSALGTSTAVENAVKLSTVDKVPLANPAEVVYSVATEYVGHWLATLMSWLVLSSLFAALLAFQNSAARYFFSMGRAGVLPRPLDRVNRGGAPIIASITTAVITGIVILVFVLRDLDPVVNLFFWMSGLAVVAIALVEAMVCVAVIVFFRRSGADASVWRTVVAPILAFIGLVLGIYLLVSHFGLLAGTSAKGVDPTKELFGLNATGWTLVALPFAMFIIGTIIGLLRKRSENVDAVEDLVH